MRRAMDGGRHGAGASPQRQLLSGPRAADAIQKPAPFGINGAFRTKSRSFRISPPAQLALLVLFDCALKNVSTLKRRCRRDSRVPALQHERASPAPRRSPCRDQRNAQNNQPDAAVSDDRTSRRASRPTGCAATPLRLHSSTVPERRNIAAAPRGPCGLCDPRGQRRLWTEP